MIGSFYDILCVNLDSKIEIDVDETFGIGDIRQIKFYGDSFFILANKSDKKLGYYLIEINAYDPVDEEKKPKYLINHKSNFDTKDANIHFMRNQD